MVTKPSRQDIQNRIQDEVRGIRAGAAPSMVPDDVAFADPEKEPVPTIAELGLPLSVRNTFVTLAERHVTYGRDEREAAALKKSITEKLKALISQYSVEARSFFCGENRVTHFSSDRTSLDPDKLRHALLLRRVNRAIVEAAIAEATVKTPVYTLKVSAPREEV